VKDIKTFENYSEAKPWGYWYSLQYNLGTWLTP